CTLEDLATMTDAGTDRGTDRGASLERLGPITLDRLSEWLTRPGGIASTKIQVRPVIDTHTDQAVDQHDPPEWMREAMILRDPTCVFPGCTISARSADADHIVPYIPLKERWTARPDPSGESGSVVSQPPSAQDPPRVGLPAPRRRDLCLD